MKTIAIKVPYLQGQTYQVGSEDGATIFIAVPPCIDEDRLYDAWDLAEGNLEAALLLKRLIEKAAAGSQPWAELTERERAECILQAREKLEKSEMAVIVKKGKDEKRNANRASRDAAAENGEERLDKLAPWFEKADAYLVAINSGQRGKQRLHTETEKLLLDEQKKQEPRSEKYRALANVLAQLSIPYAGRWIKERRNLAKT